MHLSATHNKQSEEATVESALQRDIHYWWHIFQSLSRAAHSERWLPRPGFFLTTVEGVVILAESPLGEVVHKGQKIISEVGVLFINGAHFAQTNVIIFECKSLVSTLQTGAYITLKKIPTAAHFLKYFWLKSLWSCLFNFYFSSLTLHIPKHTSHTHTHTYKGKLALSMHCLLHCQSVSCSRRCLLNSFLHGERTSLIPHFLTFSVPVTSRSRCPTALLTSGRRAQGMKETGVVGGEDEADGSRRSINSLSSWWLLWEGRMGPGERWAQINDWIHLAVQESRFKCIAPAAALCFQVLMNTTYGDSDEHPVLFLISSHWSDLSRRFCVSPSCAFRTHPKEREAETSGGDAELHEQPERVGRHGNGLQSSERNAP